MEQRTLRLGDSVDDYCPRERRITNHAIVAIVDNTVRQTRCSTCESEHVYKHGKAPRRRKPAGSSEDLAGGQLVAPRAAAAAAAEADQVESDPLEALHVESAAVESEVAEAAVETPDPAPEVVSAAAAVDDGDGDGEAQEDRPDEVWGTHRRLIRATLPKTDEPPPPRPIPEFTMHQRQTRGGQGRHGRSGNGNGNVNGNHNATGNGGGNANGNSKGSGRRRGRNRGQNKRPR